MMLRCSKGEMGEVILDPTKIRDGEPFEAIHLFLQSIEVGTDREGKPVKSATLIPAIPGIFAERCSDRNIPSRHPYSDARHVHKLDFFRSAFGTRPPDEWVHRTALLELWEKETGKKRSQCDAFLSELVRAGYLERGEKKHHGCYRPSSLGQQLLSQES